STGSTMTITFNALTAFQPYDLYFYASNANPAGTDVRTTNFTIAGTSLAATTTGAPPTFIEGNNFVRFRSQLADASGHLVVTVQGTGGSSVFPPEEIGGI